MPPPCGRRAAAAAYWLRKERQRSTGYGKNKQVFSLATGYAGNRCPRKKLASPLVPVVTCQSHSIHAMPRILNGHLTAQPPRTGHEQPAHGAVHLRQGRHHPVHQRRLRQLPARPPRKTPWAATLRISSPIPASRRSSLPASRNSAHGGAYRAAKGRSSSTASRSATRTGTSSARSP